MNCRRGTDLMTEAHRLAATVAAGATPTVAHEEAPISSN